LITYKCFESALDKQKRMMSARKEKNDNLIKSKKELDLGINSYKITVVTKD